MRSCIFSIISPVFSVTWSSEIILIYWFIVGLYLVCRCIYMYVFPWWDVPHNPWFLFNFLSRWLPWQHRASESLKYWRWHETSGSVCIFHTLRSQHKQTHPAVSVPASHSLSSNSVLSFTLFLRADWIFFSNYYNKELSAGAFSGIQTAENKALWSSCLYYSWMNTML